MALDPSAAAARPARSIGREGGAWILDQATYEPGHRAGRALAAARAVVILAACLVAGFGFAAAPASASGPGSQDPTSQPTDASGSSSAGSSADGSPTAGSPTDGSSTDGSSTTTVNDTSPPPVLGAFGVSAGFPSYQTVAGYLSAQYQYLGFQVKGSYTAVGPYVALELRGYPPVPVPVPLFVGIGGGYYGGNVTYFGTLGAHVPLSLHVRLDLEGGVANVPLLAKRAWAPYLSVGVSYAFPFVPTHGGYGPEAAAPMSLAGSPGPVCEKSDTPDRGMLLEAFHRTVKGFLDSARATYGSIYTDLSYSFDVTSVRVSGDHGVVKIHYKGSVRTIATGKRESASGNASAVYRWNGCGWSTVDVSY